mmetsp:Transcript_215/g.294  ORF Transcript_215/g.294 Transcript_215/m.294 type:complete len:272 (-) Transcript_215:361-1176(-)
MAVPLKSGGSGTCSGTQERSSLPSPSRPCSPHPKANTALAAAPEALASTSVWWKPQLTRTGRGPPSLSKKGTTVGRTAMPASEPLVGSESRPSWPALPSPHTNSEPPTSPSSSTSCRPGLAMAAVWKAPQETEDTKSAASPSTSRGEAAAVLLPWPSMPLSPAPHENSLPSVDSSAACRWPQDRAATEHLAGSNTGTQLLGAEALPIPAPQVYSRCESSLSDAATTQVVFDPQQTSTADSDDGSRLTLAVDVTALLVVVFFPVVIFVGTSI